MTIAVQINKCRGIPGSMIRETLNRMAEMPTDMIQIDREYRVYESGNCRREYHLGNQTLRRPSDETRQKLRS